MVSLDSPGCWKYSKDFVPRQSRVYFNLFNNQWTTNFRLWNEGTWTSRVRLWAAEGGDMAKTLVVPAAEARAPLAAGFAAGPGGRLPATQRGLEVSSPGTLVTAFGPNPDGAGTVLRLWECAGRGGECDIRLPDGCHAATAQSVDLRGQPQGAPVAIQNRQFRAAVEPFAPATFRVASPLRTRLSKRLASEVDDNRGLREVWVWDGSGASRMWQLFRNGRCTMRSPFPGMDPYIEACGLWEDFHEALIAQDQGRLGTIGSRTLRGSLRRTVVRGARHVGGNRSS